MVLKYHNQAFIDALTDMPIDQNLFNHWRKHQEIDPLQKALRFVLLSNFSHLGQANTLALIHRDVKSLTLRKIPMVNELLQNVIISNLDFEKFIKSIVFGNDKKSSNTFIYADPPYSNKTNNYELKWTTNDTIRLFLVLTKSNCKFAISETQNDFILFLANKFNLNVIEIGDYTSLSTTRKEILITNY